MASPIGHTLIGLALAETRDPSRSASRWWWYAVATVSVNFADFDFLPGLLVGDINRFHRSITHSLLAALIFGLAVLLLARLLRAPAVRAGLIAAGLYTTHLLLDFLSGNPSEASGQPFLWPFLSEDVMSPWSPLAGVFHGVPGDGVWQFLQTLLSWHNLEVIVIELLVFAPFFLVARRLRRAAPARYVGLEVRRRSEPEGSL